MKRIALFTVLTLALMTSSGMAMDAAGSSLGNLCTAQPLGMGIGNFSIGIGLADLTSVSGGFGYGISEHTDGRIRLALVDDENIDTKIALGVDFKYQLVSVDSISNGPFDMGLGAFVEYVDVDAWSVFQVGGQYIGSYPVKLNSGRTLTPYGRFNIRIESISWEGGSAVHEDETNLEFGLNGGVMWELTNTINLFGEFQIDGNDGVFFGIDFNVL